MINKPDITDSEFAINNVIDPATGVNNKVDPSSTKKNQGWDKLEKPPREFENWLDNQSYLWSAFVDQFFEVFKGQTSNATPIELFLNGVTDNRLVLDEDTNIVFEATVSAFLNDATQSKSWKIKGEVIRNELTYISNSSTEIIAQNNWDITSIGATSGNSGAQGGTPQSIFFKPDGTVVYLIGHTSNSIYQYPLSTAWDITTIGTTTGNSGFFGEEGTPRSIFFKPDGTMVYVIGLDVQTVYQYPLSTPWDIASIGSSSGNSGTLSEESTPNSIFFKPDGTEMYLIGIANDTVYQYPLSTPWGIASIGSSSGNSGALSEETTPESIFFKPDGTEMYLIGTANDTVYQYPLSTPWGITSIGTVSGNSGALTEESSPNSIFFKPDGTEMYLIGTANDTVYQYPLPLNWDVNFEADITNNALVPKVIGEASKTINWKIKLEKLVNNI